MNLVEAVVDGDAVALRRATVIPLDPARRPGKRRPRRARHPPGGVRGRRVRRPEPAAGSSVQVEVLEELGSDAHVFFQVDARRPEVDLGSDADDDGAARRADDALHRPGRPARPPRGRVRRSSSPSTRPRFHFFDPETGAALAAEPETAADTEQVPWRPRRTGLDHERTGRSRARRASSVLDLIEQLGVGEAIPSERQLCADLGVSRLTVRAALDELVREGYLVRRRGSGHVRQRAEDRAGADDDLLHRGHAARAA